MKMKGIIVPTRTTSFPPFATIKSKPPSTANIASANLSMAGKSLLRRGAVAAASKLAAEGAPASGKRTPSKPRNLYKRLSALGAVGGTVTEAINQFIAERRRMSKVQLLGCVKELRSHLRYKDALEILEWMEKQNATLKPPDYAIRLDLISKVQGLPAAENYFNSLLLSAKGKYVYGSLLNCYCKEMMEDKALALFKEMELLGYTPDSLVFNNLMNLYLKMGEPEKVPLLVEEMKHRMIPLHSFSYNVWMQSCALRDDIEGVETVFQVMVDNNPDLCDWTTYRTLATCYIKAGLYEMAESALKKLESAIPRKGHYYKLLISMYAYTSNPKEVYRIWESLKLASATITNNSYYIMLLSLERLEDFEGLQKCFKEWESSYTSYDFRVTKPVIRAYLKQDMVEEAEFVYKEAASKASAPYFGFTELFMVYFLEKGRADLALDYVKDAVAGFKEKDWVPHAKTVDAFFKHFEESKDVESAEEVFMILKEASGTRKMAYDVLLRTYSASGKSAPEMRQMLEKDKIEVDSELQKLLDNVCCSSKKDLGDEEDANA